MHSPTIAAEQSAHASFHCARVMHIISAPVERLKTVVLFIVRAVMATPMQSSRLPLTDKYGNKEKVKILLNLHNY